MKLVEDLSGAASALGAGAVVAALGAVGIQGELLPRLVRNQPGQAAVLVSAAIVAVLLLLVEDPSWVRKAALPLLAVALVLVVITGVKSLSDREQPSLALTWTEDDAGWITFEAVGKTESLRNEERMLVQLVAFTEVPSADELEQQCTFSRRRDDESKPALAVLSWQESGPDARGAVETISSVELPPDTYAVACAFVESRDRDFSSAKDDRFTWGFTLLPPKSPA